MRIQGHRGSKGTHPENTLAAFQEAYEAGAEGLELDLHLSRDGVVVIHHDEWVREYDSQDLEAPTLEELLLFLHDKSILLNLELKECPHYQELVAKVLALVAGRSNVYYSSFDEKILQEMPAKVTKAYIIENKDVMQSGLKAKELGAAIISPEYRALTKENVAALQKMGLRVIPWTVNTLEEQDLLESMGIDEIITDYPRLFKEAGDSRNKRGAKQ